MIIASQHAWTARGTCSPPTSGEGVLGLSNAADKRREARKSLNLVLARVRGLDKGALCRVRNLSARGFMIETPDRWTAGQRISLAFPGIELSGATVWTREAFAGIEIDAPFCPDKVTSNYALSWDRLSWEHEYIELIGDALAATVASSVPVNSVLCHKVRQKFSQALRAHLKHEDWVIYPALLKEPDFRVVDIAAQLQADYGDLERMHTEYTGKWVTTTIESNWLQFCLDTRNLLAVARLRSSREETELYAPLRLGRGHG